MASFSIPAAIAAAITGTTAAAATGAAATGAAAAAAGASTALTLSEVGSGIAALGSVASGIASGNEAAYQAHVATQNAKIANQNSQGATEAGDIKAQQIGLRAAAEEGSIKASEGAGGIDVNTGSAADVQSSERVLGENAQQTTRYNAALQAYGYQTQAKSDEAQAGLYDTEAETAPIAGAVSGAGSLIGGFGSAGLKYASWQNASDNGVVAGP